MSVDLEDSIIGVLRLNFEFYHFSFEFLILDSLQLHPTNEGRIATQSVKKHMAEKST